MPKPTSFPAEGGGPLRLFFGALNREADWAPWIAALNRVFAAAPERWQVEVVHDRAFCDALRLPSRRFTPTCDYATYRQVMGSCHIAFLPLADTPFNRCKSDLKAIEAGGHGLAILASPVVYGASLQDGETGRLFTPLTPSWRRSSKAGWRIQPPPRPWACAFANRWPAPACSSTRPRREKPGTGASGSAGRSSRPSCLSGCRSYGSEGGVSLA